MKQVKCKSGLTGWQNKLQKEYSSLSEFKDYCRIFNIHRRLGFKTVKAAWECNPTIRGSVAPSDLSVVYFHVILNNKKKSIKESVEPFSFSVKNSLSCFITKEVAVNYLNQINIE